MAEIKITANAAEIAAAEMDAGMTALRERIRSPHGAIVAAISANGRWGYEKEGGNWVAIDKAGQAPLHFDTSLAAARRHTFDLDYPVHTVAPEPRPVRWSFQ